MLGADSVPGSDRSERADTPDGREGAPTRTLSRARAVVVLHRLAGQPSPAAGHSFTDMADPHLGFAQTAVAWAASEGIVRGRTPTEFAPLANISRASFVTEGERSLQLTTPHAGYSPFGTAAASDR